MKNLQAVAIGLSGLSLTVSGYTMFKLHKKSKQDDLRDVRLAILEETSNKVHTTVSAIAKSMGVDTAKEEVKVKEKSVKTDKK